MDYFIFLQSFELAHVCVQVTLSQQYWKTSESIEEIIL